MHDRLRQLPSIDRLLERDPVETFCRKWGRPLAVAICRSALAQAKKSILDGARGEVSEIVENELGKAFDDARLNPLQKVINATGILLHTNLGRAPYGAGLLSEAFDVLSGATGVEMDMVTGRRGVRGKQVRETLARICSAEKAIVVNNNSAAILLSLSALAKGREVIVSRGELIQIGGGFRIPDVIVQGGAKLREVGTTNVTTLDDYRKAIGEESAALLKVHLSNFHMGGFARRPDTRELASLKSSKLVLVEDLGSGCLIERFDGKTLPDPTPARTLSDGADIVCFSGDKLLGGPQAGIIAGRGDLVEKIGSHPLMRALRPDKFTYVMLQAALACYEKGEPEKLAPWRFLTGGKKAVRDRAIGFRESLGLDADKYPIIECFGRYGAGSLPDESLPSSALVLTRDNVEDTASLLRRSDPPVLALIRDGALLLDFLAIVPDDLPELRSVIRNLPEI